MYMENPDLILLNGIVISMEDNVKNATAVAVAKGRIIFVGKDEDVKKLAKNGTEIVDLKGQTLLPGFNESHMHPVMYANNLLGVECGGENTKSLNRVLSALEEKVKVTPKGEWIKGFGWDDSKFLEKRNPTRWDLDKVSPNNPVVLKRTCVHVVVANSAALKLANIDKNTPDPEGGHIQKDQNGEPNGILQERAMELLPTSEYTLEQLKEGMEIELGILAKYGVTSIGDMAGQPEGFKIFQQLKKENKLTVRVRIWPIAVKTITGNAMFDDLCNSGIESGFGDDMLKVQGMKYVLDGSVSGRTAAVYEPFYNDPNAKGIIYCDSEDEMIESVKASFKNGFRVSIHAIGDRAIDFALNVFEKAGEGFDLPVMRNRMEHCVLPTKEQLLRIKKLGIIVGSSYGFLYSLGEGYLNALGPERVKKALPQKSFQEFGIIAPGNTDCPVCSVNPMWAMYGVVMRKSFLGSSLGDEERIDVMEALRTYTTYPAYSTFDDDSLGSIKEGKLADMVVLEKNILEIDPEEIKDLEVSMTIMNGEIIYRK